MGGASLQLPTLSYLTISYLSISSLSVLIDEKDIIRLQKQVILPNPSNSASVPLSVPARVGAYADAKIVVVTFSLPRALLVL